MQKKVSYINGGLLRSANPSDAVGQICKDCDLFPNKQTGMWSGGITVYDVQQMLFNTGYGSLVKMGPEGKEMVARVPPEVTDKTVIEVHRYLSTVQAKQAMKTCDACGEFCRQALEGDLKEPVVIV